ncbi:MAG: hypothetical protein ABSD21_05335 [Rhizomicrobium sp.]
MGRILAATTVAVALMANTGSSFANQAAKVPPAWLTVEVHSSTIADKAQAYVGDGDQLDALPNFGGGLSSIILGGGHAYLAGEVHSSTAMMLTVDCEFKNVSEVTQTFHPLDVELGNKAGVLMAAGIGGGPFAKSAATWARLRKTELQKIEKGNTLRVTYVFGVSKNVSGWKLIYHSNQNAELNPEKR